MANSRKSSEVTPAPAATPQKPTGNGAGRNYVSQADVPRHTIDEALRVARAISDEYGKQPTRPLDVAAAMGMKPSTGLFKMLTGASIAYGFTEGGAQADDISLTAVGRRVVAPTEEGDDIAAMREALLKPRVVREFLEKYDGSRLPRIDIGRNVLEQMGVAAKATERTFGLIVESADTLGLLREIKGDKYVNLRAAVKKPEPTDSDLLYDDEADDDEHAAPTESPEEIAALVERTDVPAEPLSTVAQLKTNRKVFISHGKDKAIVNQLKELLTYGDFEPVVSVEIETTSKPVPDKVMDDMRACGAGIIHVGTERKVTDDGGNEHQMLNQNVLIEIGAALALYEGRFILLVEQGTTLPSNLQGLYQVRYEGKKLDGDATLKLLKAFKNFKG